MIGRRLLDRYDVLERIGEGGMGTVYLARQEPLGRLVAVKVLQTELADVGYQLQRFINEARILAQLRHPHTVKLHDFGALPSGQLFIAMDYVPGGTLADALAERRFDVGTALRVARQVLSALAEAHAAGVVHRDLKPSNVLFDQVFGEPVFARVADFGIAKVEPAIHELEGKGRLAFIANLTAPGTRLGSPAYISPEQAFGRPVDARSDLYAVGLLLYEMLTGHRPFESACTQELYLAQRHEPPRALNDISPSLNVPPDLERLVLALLAKAPEARPVSAVEVVRMLDTLLARQPVAPVEPVVFEALPRPAPVEAPVELPRSSGPPPWAWGVLFGGILLLLAAALFTS